MCNYFFNCGWQSNCAGLRRSSLHNIVVNSLRCAVAYLCFYPILPYLVCGDILQILHVSIGYTFGKQMANCIQTGYKQWNVLLIITVRRSAFHGLWDRNSVRLSVCLSHSWTVHTVWPTIMISSPYGSPIILVSGDITIIPKFEGSHPERGRWMRVGWVRICDYRPISRRISETVRDTTYSLTHSLLRITGCGS